MRSVARPCGSSTPAPPAYRAASTAPSSGRRPPRRLPRSRRRRRAGPLGPAPSGSTATLNSDGSATAPANAPQQVKDAIAAANAIRDTPYVWGGGHGSFESSGYDCSGAVSYALHGGGFLDSPLDSTAFMSWGEPGVGNWITVYANSGHAYAMIAGLRWDTSDSGGDGPSWADYSSSWEQSQGVHRHPPRRLLIWRA